jgi:hypothetical protein
MSQIFIVLSADLENMKNLKDMWEDVVQGSITLRDPDVHLEIRQHLKPKRNGLKMKQRLLLEQFERHATRGVYLLKHSITTTVIKFVRMFIARNK